MTDEYSAEEPALYERKARASRAEAVLSDQLVTEAFENLTAAYRQQIEDAPIRDIEGVQILKIMLAAVKQVKGHLEHAIRDGKVATKNLSNIEQMRSHQDGGGSWHDREMKPGGPV
jgi:hypothetical protein